jgi:hypothetical protein
MELEERNPAVPAQKPGFDMKHVTWSSLAYVMGANRVWVQS